MKKHLILLATLVMSASLYTGSVFAATQKEWTFLIFLNGHNNLDSYGKMNIKGMEEVGSNDKVNVVVQWASLANKKTKRLYITKSTNSAAVTSQVVEELPAVDMGSYKNFVEFMRWGAEKYPAQKYFVTIWNHGAGWHRDGTKNRDISWDDNTGNNITTEELGVAMGEFAKIIGHKVDIYGSDACLMAMPEVAAEMQDSVEYFVGSQETEPGEGWPYSTFLKAWYALPDMNGADVSKALSQEYLKSYSGGIYGNKPVTFSAFDLKVLPEFEKAIAGLSNQLGALSTAQYTALKTAANATESYAYSDYKDLIDFMDRLKKVSTVQVNADVTADVYSATKQLVIANDVSPSYSASHGISVWLPTYSYDYADYGKRYEGLVFHKMTGWGNVLAKIAQ